MLNFVHAKITACGDRTRDQRIKSPTLYLTELTRHMVYEFKFLSITEYIHFTTFQICVLWMCVFFRLCIILMCTFFRFVYFLDLCFSYSCISLGCVYFFKNYILLIGVSSRFVHFSFFYIFSIFTFSRLVYFLDMHILLSFKFLPCSLRNQAIIIRVHRTSVHPTRSLTIPLNLMMILGFIITRNFIPNCKWNFNFLF